MGGEVQGMQERSQHRQGQAGRPDPGSWHDVSNQSPSQQAEGLAHIGRPERPALQEVAFPAQAAGRGLSRQKGAPAGPAKPHPVRALFSGSSLLPGYILPTTAVPTGVEPMHDAAMAAVVPAVAPSHPAGASESPASSVAAGSKAADGAMAAVRTIPTGPVSAAKRQRGGLTSACIAEDVEQQVRSNLLCCSYFGFTSSHAAQPSIMLILAVLKHCHRGG